MASWLSTLMFGNGGSAAPSATQQAYDAATKRRGQVAQSTEQSYLDADNAFDPQQALNQYSEGAISNFHTQLSKELAGLKDSEAGGGRLNSGFFDEDQGKVATDLGTQLQSDLNQHALETAGMRQQQIAQRGQYAQGANQDYNDLLSGELDRQQAADNAKRQQKGSLLGAGATIAGTIFGGPIGGAIAKKVFS